MMLSSTLAPSGVRVPGLDVARFLAVAGMVLEHARSDLAADEADAAALRTLAGAGSLFAIPGLLVLAVPGGLDALGVAVVDGGAEPAAALVSTTGLCLLVVAGCLRLVPRDGARWAPWVAAGGMPLSANVGHALLFPLIARVTTWGLGVATAVPVAGLVLVVAAATPWRCDSEVDRSRD